MALPAGYFLIEAEEPDAIVGTCAVCQTDIRGQAVAELIHADRLPYVCYHPVSCAPDRGAIRDGLAGPMTGLSGGPR